MEIIKKLLHFPIHCPKRNVDLKKTTFQKDTILRIYKLYSHQTPVLNTGKIVGGNYHYSQNKLWRNCPFFNSNKIYMKDENTVKIRNSLISRVKRV